MNNNYNETDWISKEKRELFCKSVNSILMTNKDVAVEEALMNAKSIVDTAFKNYPDGGKVEFTGDTSLGEKWQKDYNKRSEIQEIQKEL
jgi:hypothetical protein